MRQFKMQVAMYILLNFVSVRRKWLGDKYLNMRCVFRNTE